jgi:hypothetical protein
MRSRLRWHFAYVADILLHTICLGASELPLIPTCIHAGPGSVLRHCRLLRRRGIVGADEVSFITFILSSRPSLSPSEVSQNCPKIFWTI